MNPQDYINLSELSLLELCSWREGQNQGSQGMRAIAHSIRNRTLVSSWWNRHHVGNYAAVILQPEQYSSFNPTDPNHDKWPGNADAAFALACDVCAKVYTGADAEDLTDGATHYYDTSISFPKAWGNESDWINTLNIENLRFWKLKPPVANGGIDLSIED
jgi:Cell Wall Hydrolase